jgi:flagellar basal-body rod protein FlgB
MIDALFNTSNYTAAKQMLDFTVLRQEAIASNLANLETPNYKRIDVAPSFVDALRRAVGTGDTERIRSTKPTLAIDTTRVSGRGDGNTVELESELAELNQTLLAHTLETQLVSGTLQSLRLAITGRPA